MRRLFARLFLAALLPLATLALPARAQDPNGFSFTSGGVITLDVAEIEVSSDYVAPMKEPNVEHLLPITPSDAVRLWASSRLKAGGSAGRARIVIHDAAVVEEELKRTGGVKGWFTKDQSERYTGRLAVEVLIDKPSGFTGSASAAVARSTSVREDVSLADRDKTMLTLVRELTGDLDAQLSQAIKTALFQVVIL
ncbi:hypothetical protein [Oleisolibacter albus]|uniref:hypothetical protein n=1 Tax=Oleisolibacter albus TaxID=2171757 RepID=UPI000DF1A1D9|nr:hypothetical protein [Oleisolibacter albus]